MSAMKDLAYDIEQLYIDGLNVGQIAEVLNCDKSMVTAWIADNGVRPFDKWSASAKSRLITDLYDPHNTVNS